MDHPAPSEAGALDALARKFSLAYGHEIDRDVAREAAQNLLAFFKLLDDWDKTANNETEKENTHG